METGIYALFLIYFITPSSLPVFVKADIEMINIVVRNLISNAIKFTDKGGRVFITCSKSEEELAITVNDTGIGIEKERLDNLFRIDEAVSIPGTHGETGTGLGLLLCKEFVEKNNGKILVISNEGEGSSFTITLPLWHERSKS